jgi:small-conductance mechanosensitive channel
MNLRDLLEHQLFQIGNFTLTVFMLFGVILIWLAGWLILRAVSRFIRQNKRLLEYSDPGRRHSLYLIAQYIVWLLSLLAVFEVLGLRISVLLAGSAAFLVGIGLGLQQIFRDIASGIFLLFEGTIEIDDILVLDGNVVRVMEINLRTSKLLTRDGQTLIVPNHKFITENVANWTHSENDPSRFSIQLPVHYENDVALVQKLILTATETHSDVVQNDPKHPILVRMVEIGKGTMSFELLFWTHRKFEAENVKSDLRYAIRLSFEKNEIRYADPV